MASEICRYKNVGIGCVRGQSKSNEQEVLLRTLYLLATISPDAVVTLSLELPVPWFLHHLANAPATGTTSSRRGMETIRLISAMIVSVTRRKADIPRSEHRGFRDPKELSAPGPGSGATCICRATK